MQILKSAIGSAAALSMLLVHVPAQAKTPGDLNDLVGARGSSGENALETRGYVHHHTAEADAGKYSYWWNPSNKQCVRILTSDGRYQEIRSVGSNDCGQKGAGGDNAAAIAIGAAALIGVAALASKSHHRNDKEYDTQGTAEFERGYRDGLYNQTYHNYSRTDAYSDGYSAGVKERGQQTSYRDDYSHHAGYEPYSGYADIVGRSNDTADSMLRQRGFVFIGKDSSGSGHERTYWNGATRQCISVRTRSGSVADAHAIRNRNCR